MSQADTIGKQDDDGDREEPKAFFFYVAQKIVSALDVATGAEIKTIIKAAVPSFDPTHILVLEGHRGEEDRVIQDNEKVSLVVGHGHEPKHFFSKPPTNFGEA